jgi:hypothetical protein
MDVYTQVRHTFRQCFIEPSSGYRWLLQPRPFLHKREYHCSLQELHLGKSKFTSGMTRLIDGVCG